MWHTNANCSAISSRLLPAAMTLMTAKGAQKRLLESSLMMLEDDSDENFTVLFQAGYDTIDKLKKVN